MELLLIRHALPVRRELVVGAADPELSEAGQAQAAHLAEYLATERLDARLHQPAAARRRDRRPGRRPSRARAGDRRRRRRVGPHVARVRSGRGAKAADDPRWRALVDGVWTSDESPGQFRARVLGRDRAPRRCPPGRPHRGRVPRWGDQHLPRRRARPRSDAARLLLPELHVDPPRDGSRAPGSVRS